MATFNDVPFNFVPLNHEVFIPDWGDKISQDIPFEDGEDGIIRLRITNTTPLFIKNDTDKKNADSAFVEDADGVRHYYIPASSVKGMLRSTVEILSFAWLKQYNDDFFGYRTFGGRNDARSNSYKTKMENVRCGWLRMMPDGKTYKLGNCGAPEKVAMEDLPCYYQDTINKDAVEKCKWFRSLGYGYYPRFNGKRLVCSGFMNSKRHEYLFPEPEEAHQSIVVSDEVIDEFKSVYKPSRRYHDFIEGMLRKGERLAVFFKNSKDGVESIGLTRMYRYPYKRRVADGVVQIGYDELGHKTDGRDLAECMFGFTDKDKQLRGRVQFGNAFCQNTALGDMEEVKGVLGQPNASYYPYYLKQGSGNLNNYDSSSIEIAGRKRYRIQPQGRNVPEGNDNDSVKSTLKPLPAGCHFVCELRVHNMKPIEIGALLSAISYHGHAQCHHNIGMAKAMGYGRLEIDITELDFLAHDVCYYMTEFEREMTLFLYNTRGERWIHSAQLSQLFAIAADHEEVLGYMDFDGYEDGRRDSDSQRLSEDTVAASSLLSESEYADLLIYKQKKAKEKAEQEERKARELAEEQKRKREEQERAQAEAEAKAREEARLAVLSSGLSALLEAKNQNGGFKVERFAQANNNVESWKKKAGRPLTDDEVADLQATLVRVKKGTSKKKELQELLSIDSKEWRRLATLIGEDRMRALYDNLINGEVL